MSEKEDVLSMEDDLLRGLLEAADDRENEVATIEIVRKKKVYFKFRIRPIAEKEANKCNQNATKFTKNRQGIRIAEDTDIAKYRSLLIYTATIDEDKRKLWDSQIIRDKLNVLSGIDVIDKTLLPGEKEAIIEKINQISGYADEDELEELAKN